MTLHAPKIATNATVGNQTTAHCCEIWRKPLLFLCKRGNLETELLLVNYITTLSQRPSPETLQLIEQFLHESDQDLFHWLLKTSAKRSLVPDTPPAQYQPLIKEIRANYLNFG